MVSSAPQTQNLTLHLLLEKTEEGRSRATALEFPDCSTEAPTDELAIEQLRQSLSGRLAQSRVVEIEVALPQPTQSDNPWIKYAGVFKDDPYFAKVMEQMNAERQGED